MYKIALIQNQSEMSHYGYADARHLLRDFGYQIILYTAQNIDDLPFDLTRFNYNAIIFASNALNDKTIRNIVKSKEFIEKFRNFINSGKGALILHQLRMAQDEIPLEFLPDNLNRVHPKVRGESETASEGDLKLSSVAKDHVFLLYPNPIEIEEIKNQCLTYKSLKGLYWHYWDDASNTDWDELLYDEDSDGIKRPLIISSKESDPFRIVLCSLTLDWQKQKPLLQNILTVLVEGKHKTAILKDFQTRNAGFEYFIERLKSLQFAFRIYDKNENLVDFERNIRNGVHSIVVFGPCVDPDKIDPKIKAILRRYLDEGQIKQICISQDIERTRFFIEGKERFAFRLLYDLELKIQNELRSGFIDGSFWSTVESLQILDEISLFTKSKFDKQTLNPIIEKVNTHHDKKGSYDEVFGVTCALLWLRAKYLGKNDENTQRTLFWIRNCVSDYEDREKALAYYTIIKSGLATNGEKDSLRNLLIAQQDKIENLSDNDLIAYLKAGILIGHLDIIISIIQRLENTQENGFWIDLETTAVATTTILDSISYLKKTQPNIFAQIKNNSESMIFKSVINIQNSLQDMSSGKITYPWDNKARTSLNCLQAWLKFEEIIDMPVLELTDTIMSYSIVDTMKSSSITSLTILEELRRDNRETSNKFVKFKVDYEKLEDSLKPDPFLRLSLFVIAYLSATVIIYSYLSSTNWNSMKAILYGTFVDNFIIQVTVIGLLIGGYKLYPIFLEMVKTKVKSNEK